MSPLCVCSYFSCLAFNVSRLWWFQNFTSVYQVWCIARVIQMFLFYFFILLCSVLCFSVQFIPICCVFLVVIYICVAFVNSCFIGFVYRLCNKQRVNKCAFSPSLRHRRQSLSSSPLVDVVADLITWAAMKMARMVPGIGKIYIGVPCFLAECCKRWLSRGWLFVLCLVV